MDRRSLLGTLAWASLGAPARASLRRPSADLQLVERWSWVMGQPVHLQLYAEREDAGLEAASAALAELRRVEGILSRFDDASDLSEVNRMAGRAAVRVHPDLVALLAAADDAKSRTRGAFNIAVEPLMRAWGFRDARRTPPTAREVREARAAVAAAEIRIAGERVQLASRTTQLDPGGIGVGFGLDRAARVLRDHGIDRALLDISGDCIALGAPPGERAWEIGIARPGSRTGVRRVVPLRDAALATSANTESVVRLGALLVGHVMDPARGRPADHRQVTVVAATGVLADALSTGALVSGHAVEGGVSV